MQIKEFEAQTLKECLQLVRSAMGPDAVILETRKFRKGGVMGLGAHDAIAIVAATGITVDSDKPNNASTEPEQRQTQAKAQSGPKAQEEAPVAEPFAEVRGVRSAAAHVAARGVYGRGKNGSLKDGTPGQTPEVQPDPYAALLEAPGQSYLTKRMRELATRGKDVTPAAPEPRATKAPQTSNPTDAAANGASIAAAMPPTGGGADSPNTTGHTGAFEAADRSISGEEDRRRLAYLEKAMGEIRECLIALQREHSDGIDRTVSAVVSAVAPAVTAVNAAGFAAYATDLETRYPELQEALRASGVSDALIDELFDQLPDMGAWSPKAQEALAISAIRDLIARRIATVNTIELTPGEPKLVALIGPTGVGKTTTLAKLAANFALLQRKRVALITVDTYRIAAVEQLRTYSQIIGIPVSVASSHEELPKILAEYADYDLVLIDTAGRSQRHVNQIAELKALMDTVRCEAHLVLAASTNEQDMIDAARRFSGSQVDRIIFSKLDETSRYGVLFNVADRTGIPLSFLTTGQKVPEDIEAAQGVKLADLILTGCTQSAALIREAAGR